MADDQAYYRKIKADIANKKAQLIGLKEIINKEKDDNYSCKEEIRRLESEISNLEAHFK